jgi:hypothetical protein
VGSFSNGNRWLAVQQERHVAGLPDDARTVRAGRRGLFGESQAAECEFSSTEAGNAVRPLEYGKIPLPETTLEGDPAKSWCHICDPVQAFKSLEALQEHMKKVHWRQQR